MLFRRVNITTKSHKIFLCYTCGEKEESFLHRNVVSFKMSVRFLLVQLGPWKKHPQQLPWCSVLLQWCHFARSQHKLIPHRSAPDSPKKFCAPSRQSSRSVNSYFFFSSFFIMLVLLKIGLENKINKNERLGNFFLLLRVCVMRYTRMVNYYLDNIVFNKLPLKDHFNILSKSFIRRIVLFKNGWLQLLTTPG